jgi:hypothetical protein
MCISISISISITITIRIRIHRLNPKCIQLHIGIAIQHQQTYKLSLLNQ